RSGDVTPRAHAHRLILMNMIMRMFTGLPALVLTIVACRRYEIDADLVIDWLDAPHSLTTVFSVLASIIVLAIPLQLFAQAAACRFISPRGEGAIGRWSPEYLRVWLATGLVARAGVWLSGSLFWPTWLRLAGMTIGRGSEISTIIDVIPKLVEIGDESFFADGVYLAGPRIHRGTVATARTRLGRNTFLGNHAVVPAGVTLPADILIGICTVADEKEVRPSSSWFGHPAFELPNREVVQLPRELTHDPGLLRYLTRLFWELLRLALPLLTLAAALLWVTIAHPPGTDNRLSLVHATLASLTAAAISCLTVVALKWLLLGRVRPGQHAFWSCWCGRWDFLYVAWGRWARPLLSSLEQTVWLTFYLRAMGCRIGQRALLGLGFAQVVDPDMIQIEDDATVNGLFQAHSFEDRVLKTDHVCIRRGATTKSGSVLLYGADIGEGTIVASHSVVMKREKLFPGRLYGGCPTRELRR
ncbi:MAG: amino acid adenylation protein, partial [Planctomycetes bacterium]|nr:amino acid adenylation protein [Planctomycetota bacterium]